MRKKLADIEDVRTSFSGIFVRYGTKSAYRGDDIPTILLKDIMQGDRVVSDHIWFTMTKGFSKLGFLHGGEEITFHARVKEYVKGYKGWDEERQLESPLSVDYKLSHPTKIALVNQPVIPMEEDLPEFFSPGALMQMEQIRV